MNNQTPAATIYLGDSSDSDHIEIIGDADPARLIPLLHSLIDQLLEMAVAKNNEHPQQPIDQELNCDFGQRH